MKQPRCLSHKPPRPIACHGVTELLGSDKTITIMRETIGHHTDEQRTVLVSATFTTKASKVALMGQAKTPLHVPGLRFPVNLFHMIRLDGQFVTTTPTTRRQYLTPIFGLHPLAEAMNTLTTANFGLPSTLG
jgi:hypothetical protein